MKLRYRIGLGFAGLLGITVMVLRWYSATRRRAQMQGRRSQRTGRRQPTRGAARHGSVLTNLFADRRAEPFLAEMNRDDLVHLAALMASGQATPSVEQSKTIQSSSGASNTLEKNRAFRNSLFVPYQ